MRGVHERLRLAMSLRDRGRQKARRNSRLIKKVNHMTFRLTKIDRDSVRERAIQFAFGARENALKEEEDAIGRAAYASIFPEKVRKIASQLPDKWLREDKCLRLSFRGMQD